MPAVRPSPFGVAVLDKTPLLREAFRELGPDADLKSVVDYCWQRSGSIVTITDYRQGRCEANGWEWRPRERKPEGRPTPKQPRALRHFSAGAWRAALAAADACGGWEALREIAEAMGGDE